MASRRIPLRTTAHGAPRERGQAARSLHHGYRGARRHGVRVCHRSVHLRGDEEDHQHERVDERAGYDPVARRQPQRHADDRRDGAVDLEEEEVVVRVWTFSEKMD